MIDMITEFQLFRITELFFFSLLVILMVDAVTIKLIFVTIENETIPSMLDEITIFEFVVWSFRISWIIILVVLNVVVFVNTCNDIYFSLSNGIIESGSFIKE